MSLPRTRLTLLAAVALFTSLARADWREFIPRAVESGILIDAFAANERDERDDLVNAHREDWFFREKLTVYSDGYVYHPRFLRYHMSLAGALKQEKYEASGYDSRGWQDDEAWEYEARLFFLAEHPGNLQLFSRRWEPLFRDRSATQRNNRQTSNGASVGYRKKPFFFHTNYRHDTVESGPSESEVDNLSIGGQYMKRWLSGNAFSLAAGYNPADFSNSFGVDGETQESVLSSLLDLRAVRLRSSLSHNDFEQDSFSAGHIESERLTWVEELTAYLPMNLRGDVLYRYQDATSQYPQQTALDDTELSQIDRDLQVSLFHKLYESLDTTYLYLRGERESGGGESTSENNVLAVNYSKMIPRGRVLAGSNFNRAENDNRGRTEIPNEPHPNIDVPGVFLLNQQSVGQQEVDLASIAVFLRSPLAPFDIVPLSENVHYTVMPVGVTVEIRVFDLPPEFVVPGQYDFVVSYALASGDFELQTDTFGCNLRVQLFDELLIPYFSFVTSESEVRSGEFPGNPADSTTRTLGLTSEREALQGRIEYQSVDWDVNPYDSWRFELRSVGAFTETLDGNVATSYLKREYDGGAAPESTQSYKEEIASSFGNLQKRFPSNGMTLSAGGSWTRTESLVDTTAYSINSTLAWRIGRLELTISGIANFSDTSGGNVEPTKRSHQYYYAMLRRKID